VIPKRLNDALGTITVETLLALSPPRLFTTIGKQDWYSHSHRTWIDEHLFPASYRVLEVGCATGALTAYLAGSASGVTGLDRSPAMIRQAASAHPHLDFCVGDATTLPYDDNAFDAVIAASVINIVADPKPVLSEMHRVCAPGGTVSLLVPSTGFTDEHLDTLIATRGLTGFSKAAITKWHHNSPKMSRSQIETLLRNVDLEAAVTRSYLDGMLTGTTGSDSPDSPLNGGMPSTW